MDLVGFAVERQTFLPAQVKGPICVVDANLRSPGLHQMFGVENHHGLSDALEATESIRTFCAPTRQTELVAP